MTAQPTRPRRLMWLSLVAALIAAFPAPTPSLAQQSQQTTRGIDDLYPPDAEPGGAATGQRAGCYRKGTALRKCFRCCQRVAPGSHNCIRGCYYNLVPRDRWPE